MCFSAHSPNTIAQKTLLSLLHLISSHRLQSYCILSCFLPYIVPRTPIASTVFLPINTLKSPRYRPLLADDTHLQKVFSSTPPAIAQWTTSEAYNFKNISLQRRWNAFTSFGMEFGGSKWSHRSEQILGLVPNMAQNLGCSAAETAFLYRPNIMQPCWRNSSDETLNILKMVKWITWKHYKRFRATSTSIKPFRRSGLGFNSPCCMYFVKLLDCTWVTAFDYMYCFGSLLNTYTGIVLQCNVY